MHIENPPNTVKQAPPLNSRSVVSNHKAEQIFNTPKAKKKNDLSANGKFDQSEARKNFWKGFKKPFQEVINYAKEKPGQFVALTSVSIGLMVLSVAFPPVGVALTTLGCCFIAMPLFKGLKQVKNAKNGDDKEKAFSNFGEAASYTVLTYGASALSKALPSHRIAETGKAAEFAHKGSGHTINFFSNATNVTSFAPGVKAAAVMAGKGVMGQKITFAPAK